MDERLFLDTNVLVRHITGDHPEQSPRARAVIRAIEAGERTVWTSHLVIAEVVFVLGGPVYGLDRDEIARALRLLIGLPGIKVARKPVLRAALGLYATHRADFIDCYHAAWLRNRGEQRVLTFDEDFETLGLERVQP